MRPMPSTPLYLIAGALLLCPVAATFGQGDDRPAVSETKLDIRWSPIIDLHFRARFLDANPPATPSPEMRPLLDAVRRINAVFGKDLGTWGVLEGGLYGCRTAADVRSAFSDLPEKFTPRGPRRGGAEPAKDIELRSLGMDLADALSKVEKHYVESVAAKNEQLVREAQRVFSERMGPNESKCLGFMIQHLGGDDPKSPIPVYLVADMPWPGAVTSIRPERAGGVCFVAVRDAEPVQLLEIILHESTHALDVVWPGTATLDQLRVRLREAGSAIQPRDLHDVPHTLMFVHSGETVRRIVDTSHRHYGDASTYYKRLSRATQAVRQPWVDYLDGKTSRDEALTRMVDALRTKTP